MTKKVYTYDRIWILQTAHFQLTNALLRKEILMNAFKTLVMAFALSFLTMGVLAQTTASVTDSASAPTTSQDVELSKKMILAQAYLEKESFTYNATGIYEGKFFSLRREMNPRGKYSSFGITSDLCLRGRLQTLFSIDSATGDLIADVQPSQPFCSRMEYRFNVMTKRGVRVVFNPQTKQPQADDPTYKFVLE